jgi:glutamine amidotransferase
MCRLLGIVAEKPTSFRYCLREAPRSLWLLSQEHPHGWGIALFSDPGGWKVRRSVARAGEDALFHEIAVSASGQVLLAHVRQRTVGRARIANTHPFRRGPWVFAHNGTIDDMDFLRRRVSSRRARQIEGETDSELLFTYLLSCLDAVDGAGSDDAEVVDAAVACALRELTDHPARSAYNFLLSNGRTLYGHKRGRPLFLLQRRGAILLASEPLTDEPWQSLHDGTLVRVQRGETVAWRMLMGEMTTSPTESGPELPFTD